jgi:glycosyltransferase involved in cell wall biosynthesis
VSSPRVLVSGVLLGQPAGGVRRHNAELLARVAPLLAEGGGRLAVMEGTQPVAFPLPPSIERIQSSVPPSPVLVRATLEGRWLRKVLGATAAPFDLVHLAHFPVPRHLPVPYSLTVHDLRDLQLAHTPMSRRLMADRVIGKAVEQAACVITVSETVRSDLLERFQLDPERVQVVPNAADHLPVLAREPGPDAPILHVGHVERRKNLELLLRALAEDRDLPPLLLAGAPKAEEDERLLALARELGVAERITFAGHVDEDQLPGLYARAACVALPSLIEGFGIPALEAQRAGVPLCVSLTGALREIAGPSTPAFAPDDPTDCVRALRAALATSDEALHAARERAQGFRWDDSATRLLEAWERAVKE